MESSTQSTNRLIFYVNGREITNTEVDPEVTILKYLRTRLNLKGTKLVCGEGGCGACTVMLSHFDRLENRIRHLAVNACLLPLWFAHGKAITTVEGIGSTKTNLHPVQERIAKSYGSQCGFCTPGMVMSMYTLLKNNPLPSQSEMENNFDGNLCRCTGYRPIIDGYRTLTKEFCGLGENCCRSSNKDGTKMECKTMFDSAEFTPFNPTQEPIFPPSLQLTSRYDSETLDIVGERVRFIRPVSLDHLLLLKTQFPGAKIITGNSEIGIDFNFKNIVYPVLIAGTHVPELREITWTQSGITFGSSVTLSDVQQTLESSTDLFPRTKCETYLAILDILKEFAGHQIRNVASVGGNIMTASPISDLNPIFLASQSTLYVSSSGRGGRHVKMDGLFFTDYRKTCILPDEVVISIHIPHTQEREYFNAYKQAHRREDDIAIVNAAFRVCLDSEKDVVKEISIAYGGMSSTTILCPLTEKSVLGLKWDDHLLETVCKSLLNEVQLSYGSPGGMESYRRVLTLSFFFKFYLRIKLMLNNSVPVEYWSGSDQLKVGVTSSSQLFEEVSPTQPLSDMCSRPYLPIATFQQATGEALFVDDLPKLEGEAFLCVVTSSKAHARIISVDVGKSLSCPGVIDYVTYSDVPVSNKWGIIVQDEEVFASKEVFNQGQVIGAILADTCEHARHAAREVEVTYDELDAVLTIEDAIQKEQYFTTPTIITKGCIDEGFSKSDNILEGHMSVGGQEHFYFETQVSLCVPNRAENEIEIFTSTQNPTCTQIHVAEALGIPMNKVVVRCKRLGGGFGGKESRSVGITVAAAVAAWKHCCPVRIVLDRDDDMATTGSRHPAYSKYKVGYNNDGTIRALQFTMYINCGSSFDLSPAVLNRALTHCSNAYRIPHCDISGYLCRTNIPSCTAFRAFGTPQSMIVCETWMSRVAEALGLPQEQVREKNLIKEGDTSCHNQVVVNCELSRCWQECLSHSNFVSRQKEVDHYNRNNRWKKKGLSIIPTMFGMSFNKTLLNQAGALVHVYLDGSVLIAHGGVEMGQGLYAKMKQVASRALGVSIDRIHTSETSTSTVPNTSASAASMTSDLNGMAVMNACLTIRQRLEPYVTANPGGTWEEWIQAAYCDRCSLSSTGFYSTPGITDSDPVRYSKVFSYYSFGVASSEVEIDCLTGDHLVLQTDIVMDVGTSLNPAIDIGQIEGAFIQGYGLMMLEQQKFSPGGYLLSRGPGTYKIPSMSNIPRKMNVSLLKGAGNPKAVYSSKGIGEPPLFLSSSVFFAVREAIKSARSDAGNGQAFQLDSPATPEKIRLLCTDELTVKISEPDVNSYNPWFVQLA